MRYEPRTKTRTAIFVCAATLVWLPLLFFVRTSHPVEESRAAFEATTTIYVSTPSPFVPYEAPPPARNGTVSFHVSDALRLAGGSVRKDTPERSALLSKKHPGYDVVVDVGAFDCSDYTIPAFELGYVVFAFEPVNWLRCVVRFEADKMRRGLDYEIVQVAPGQRPSAVKLPRPRKGFVFLYAAGASDSFASLNALGAGPMVQLRSADGYRATIPTVTLDEIVPPEAKVYLFKTDAQGHEPSVIRGGAEILKRGVGVVALELWPAGIEASGLDPHVPLAALYAAGYACFDLGVHDYNVVDRPSEIRAYVNDMLAQGTKEDHIGSWDDLICSRVGAET